MKKLEAIIRSSRVIAVKTALIDAGIHGMTLTQVAGVGQETGYEKNYRGNRIEIDTQEKIKLEIILDNDLVDIAINIITEKARTGKIGDGKILIMPIEKLIRIRTGETDQNAI